ncbi:hypothetical protein [Nitrosopumilus sp.]|uniref:hypothetical protein n=1 Tax=Nitrosopumilus sp. TaxID=2024843 RepID=UPI0034A052C5
MKTRIILPVILICIIVISGFFVYVKSTTNTNLFHHDEIRTPIPDDRFTIDGIQWEWNNYVYDVNEEINFTVSRYAKTCGDVFNTKIMNTDGSKTFWQESLSSKCDTNYEDLIEDDYYLVFVYAEFPSHNSIDLEEGMYVLEVKSQDSHSERRLTGQFVVKNKTTLSLLPCTSDRTACFNHDANLCDPTGWECGSNEGIFEEIIENENSTIESLLV